MNKPEVQESSSVQPQRKCSACSAKASSEGANASKSEKRENKGTCGACASNLPYVYALGQIEARFPSKSIEKEYVQAIGRSKTADPTKLYGLYSVLSEPQNQYLARKLSWILTVEGVPIYILLPTSPEDIDTLMKATLPSDCPLDRSVIMGRKGPAASLDMCGLEIPMVLIDHIFHHNHSAFVKSILSESISKEKFKAATEDMSRRMMQMAHNAGATDKHRALNYLAVRYSPIYARVAEELERNFLLTSVEAIPSRLSNNCKIVSVIFSFTNKETSVVEKYFIRVDVTEEFPFIVTEVSPYYDR